MVDISKKVISKRKAKAKSTVLVDEKIMHHFSSEEKEIYTPKGAVFQTAIIAGIMAAKRTSELIPLCHSLSLDSCHINIYIQRNKIIIECEVSALAKTGVEMEALTGVSTSALTIYDMCKGISSEIIIKETRLVAKSGGKKNFQLPPA